MRWLSVMRLARLIRSNVDRQLSSNGRVGGEGETGAVAMIVAILFGFGVLLGLGALVIDTGSLLYERRQLQNGADAAALAVGKDCAGNAACNPIVTGPPAFAATSTLTAMAGANASSDGVTTIESICGNSIVRTSNPSLQATAECPTSTGQLVDCPPVPSTFASAPYIEVRTKTLNANGTNILPPILAQTLAGGGYSGEIVRACSRVAWLPAGNPTGPVLPVTFSYCQWRATTGADPLANPPVPGTFVDPPAAGQNPGYGASPNTPWPPAASEVTLFTQSPQHPLGSCPTWNGHIAPGTFGELTAISCNATVTDNWVQGSNGNPAPCDLTLLNGLRGQIVNVPIFDCYTPTQFDFANPPVPAPDCNDNHPANWYHISGYAAFYLTGFNFSGSSAEGRSIFPPDHNQQPCSGSDRCISGWFTTTALSATPSTYFTPFFGSYVIQLAG